MKQFFAKYKYLLSKQAVVVFLLGFASGLPIALSGSTLQTWLADTDVSVTQIGMYSLVGLPYLYKFLWSPLLDRFRLPFLCLRRGWMLSAQLVTALCILALGIITSFASLKMIALVAVALAFCSATLDIAYDAYKVDLLNPKERASIGALGVEGYRVGVLAATALAMSLAEHISWRMAYVVMAVLMLLTTLVTIKAPQPVEAYPKASSRPSLHDLVVSPFKEFLARPKAYYLLALVVFYKFGDAYAGALTTTFFRRELGLSLDFIAAMTKGFGAAAIFIGIFFGGVFTSTIGLYRAMFTFGVLQALANLGYMVLSITHAPSAILIATCVFLENLCGGMGTAALLAFLMGLCDKRFSATQFALLSSLISVGRVLIGPLAGYVVDKTGWANFYFSSLYFAVPGLVLLFLVRSQIEPLDNSEDTKTTDIEARSLPQN